MKKKLLALAVVLGFILTVCGASTANDNAGNTPDYSQPSSCYKLPEITKDVDTFYIYATEYMGFNEGDPEYAALDNAERTK